MSRRRDTAVHGLAAHAGFLLVTGTTIGLYGASGPAVRYWVVLAAIVLPVLGTYLGARMYTGVDMLPWGVAAAGLLLQAGLYLIWPHYFARGLGRGEQSPADLAIAGAHLLLLVAALILIVRHAARDPGGIIDAAIIGLCATAPLWQWVLQPALGSIGSPPAGQALVLLDVLFLGGVLGALAHVGLTAQGARTSLLYLALALVSTLVAITMAALAARAHRTCPQVEVIMLAFLAFGTAAVHPSTRHLTAPDGQGRRRLDRPNLVFLGIALTVFPAVTLAQALMGGSSSSMPFGVGSLITTPLVLLRMAQLTRQRERAERVLRHHARHDELTGLLNRRAILERLDAELAGPHTGAPPALAVLFCDLDRFKPVNDRLGHAAGDELLQIVARRLLAGTRETDVVGRFGGDEFLVLCPSTAADTAAEIADRVVCAVRAPIVLGGATVTVGVSVGVAVADGVTPVTRDALVSAADARMYSHKHHRRVPPACGAAGLGDTARAGAARGAVR